MVDIKLHASSPFPSVLTASSRVFHSYMQPSLLAVGNSTSLASHVDPLVPFAVPNVNPTKNEAHLILALLYEQPSPFLVPAQSLRGFYEMAESKEEREGFDLNSFVRDASLSNLVAAAYFLVVGDGLGDSTTTSTVAIPSSSISSAISSASISSTLGAGPGLSLSSPPLVTLPPSARVTTNNAVTISQPTGDSKNGGVAGRLTSINSTGQETAITSQRPATSPQITGGHVVGSGSAGGKSVEMGVVSTTLTINPRAIKLPSSESLDRRPANKTGGLTVTTAAGRDTEPVLVAAALLAITAAIYWTFL